MSQYPIIDSGLRWLEVILSERFGSEWHLSRSEESLRLQLAGAEGAIVFDMLEASFVKANSNQSCAWWDATNEGWHSVLGGFLPAPSVSELPSPLIETHAGEYIIHFDILGLTYWMLARVEEIGRTDLDNHDRFPATSSHAYKHGYLDRPVVDEWLHLLGQVIQRQWPAIELKQHEFQMRLSHDVDQPSLYAFKSWYNITRMMFGHLVKRRDLKSFIIAPYVKFATRTKLNDLDPYNTFNWLLDVSERNNLYSAFYFMCGRTDFSYDADYEPEHSAIRSLMRNIYERGHEIGIHPSYNTFQNPDALKYEADRLKRVCAEEGIIQDQWGGRMHYLRWNQPITMRAWANAGMSYDATLGYADRPGFRCGTCYEYIAFDAMAQHTLNLRIRPLIVMECSVFEEVYAGLGMTEASARYISNLKARCVAVKGNFTLLWHNSYFGSRYLMNLYSNIVLNESL